VAGTTQSMSSSPEVMKREIAEVEREIEELKEERNIE